VPRKEIEEFLDDLPEAIVDPITGLRPCRETELSAILASYQQQRRIDWKKAGLKIWSQGENGFISEELLLFQTSTALLEPGRTLTEYPLFAYEDFHWERWGEMKADIIFVTEKPTAVVLFENKLDSKFTYYDWPPDGQLSRIMQYLSYLAPRFEKRFLIVLFPKTNLGWYRERLQKAAEEHPPDSNLFVGYSLWEHVFAALT